MPGYAARVPVHPDRTGSIKSVPNDLLVVHTTEGWEGVDRPEQAAAAMARPGDRPSPSRPGQFYGSSYQYVADTDDTIPAVPDNVVSYSAGGANHNGIHFVICGRAGQTRAEWLDPFSRACIREAAWSMVDRARAHRVPLERLTVAGLKAGKRGYCGHGDVSLAFGKSDHTDPGPNFPWDVLALDISTFLTGGPVMLTALELREGRVLDTRVDGGRLPVLGERVVGPIEGAAGRPAAEVTITATEWAAPGFLTLWAAGARPTTSKLNYGGNLPAIANTTTVRLATDGTFRVYASTLTHLVVDLEGLYVS